LGRWRLWFGRQSDLLGRERNQLVVVNRIRLNGDGLHFEEGNQVAHVARMMEAFSGVVLSLPLAWMVAPGSRCVIQFDGYGRVFRLIAGIAHFEDFAAGVIRTTDALAAQIRI
jgi:hypothetical protein